MNPTHLLNLVITPTLERLATVMQSIDSQGARALVLWTAATESDLHHLRQLGSGPALGLWQMEPTTERDIWINVIEPRGSLRELMMRMSGVWGEQELCGNLFYACAMCRLSYWRHPEPLPWLEWEAGEGFIDHSVPDRVEPMADYWKRYYNTALGAGTEVDFVGAASGVAIDMAAHEKAWGPEG